MPASANSGVQVVPTSATSGVSPPPTALTNLSWALAHGTNWMSTSAPVCALKSDLTLSKNGVASGLVPSMIQTVSVLPAPLWLLLLLLSPLVLSSPQPASVNAVAEAKAMVASLVLRRRENMRAPPVVRPFV